MFRFLQKGKIETDAQVIKDMGHELEKERQLVDELKKQLNFYKEREQLIATLIIDAQHRSDAIIEEAHKKAATIQRSAEHNINVRLNQIEEAAQRLVQAELEIHSRGDLMKAELREILQNQLSQVEQMDISAFSSLSGIVSDTAKEAQELITASRTVIQFPDLTNFSKKSDNELPVYNFTGEG